MSSLLKILLLFIFVSCASSHFSREEILHVLNNEDYILISADRNLSSPVDSNLSDEEVRARDKKLFSTLSKNSYRFQEIKGHYKVEEKSYLVLIKKDMEHVFIELGKSLNQESIILGHKNKHKLVFLTGEKKGLAYFGKGYRVVSSRQSEDYSEIKLKKGQRFRFSLNFNFDELCPNISEYFDGCSIESK